MDDFLFKGNLWKLCMEMVSGSGKNQYTAVSGKTSVLSSNQQLHLFLSKCLLEELMGKKRVGDTCVRESDAPN